MKDIWHYDEAAGGRWSSLREGRGAIHAETIGKMSHWCNQLHSYLPVEDAYLCSVLIAEPQGHILGVRGVLPSHISLRARRRGRQTRTDSACIEPDMPAATVAIH